MRFVAEANHSSETPRTLPPSGAEMRSWGNLVSFQVAVGGLSAKLLTYAGCLERVIDVCSGHEGDRRGCELVLEFFCHDDKDVNANANANERASKKRK